MSIKATLSNDGLDEVYTPPTLKEMCLYKCLKNKDILTKEVEIDEDMDGGSEIFDGHWEKLRLKEPIQRDLVEALLDAGEKFLFALTPKYEAVLAAIRMSQPEHLVKVHVSKSETLTDSQLKLLISGGNVKSLDIRGCEKVGGPLDVINKFGSKLEYLRMCLPSFPLPLTLENSPSLRTPNLKTFIVCGSGHNSTKPTNYWRILMYAFISNLEDLQISKSGSFETLEFLEPARNKLSSLALRNCDITDAVAWASLFKLDKLRFLDVVDSSIGEAFEGEDVVQRLLTALPNLRSLAVDPGLVKGIQVETSIRCQGPVAKRLEFIGIMDNDEDTADETELRKAKLLANDVAHIGTVEGELRALEYFSNRLNVGCFDSTLELLLKGLSDVAPWNTVTVIGLVMKTFKNNVDHCALPEVFFEYLKPLFTPDLWAKLGEVLQDQCIRAIFDNMNVWTVVSARPELVMIRDVVDIMLNLEAGLRFDHYLTIVPMVMSVAERTMTRSVLDDIGMEDFRDLLRKIARLLQTAVDRFPSETKALWGISSVLGVTNKLKDVIISAEGDTFSLLEIFGSLILSLRKLCNNSEPLRAMFHSAEAVYYVMGLLTEIIDGCLGLADRDSFALFEILQSILQDTGDNLTTWESEMIASDLEELLFSLHSKWEFWESNTVRETTHYSQFESIANLLNILDNDPRYDYTASAEVKEIMMKLK